MKITRSTTRMKSISIFLFLALCSMNVLDVREVVAQEIPNHPGLSVTPVAFNSGHDDFAPWYVYHGRQMFFTSTRSGEHGGSGDQRIWIVTRTGGDSWTEALSAGEDVSHADHVGSATVTPDGNFMIFAAYDWDAESGTLKGEGRTDLYSAEFRNGTWTNVQNLGVVVNSPFWDSQPSLSSDGQWLYFSSDREGGQGGTDLYVTQRTATGWTPPVNLGPAINTELNEMTPSIAPDGNRFFFASNGRGGVGGYDLFTTEAVRPVAGAVSRGAAVVNMGTPINTEADEYYFISEPNSENGFFSSNKEGDLNIYLAFPNPYPPDAQVVVVGKVLDERTRKPVEATVTVTDLESGEVVATMRSDDQTGEYTVLLSKGRRYSVTADAPGYVFYSDEYTVPATLKEGEEIRKDILLREGQTRLLIYFDYDKADLKKESFPDLNRAIKFLNENPTLNAEIAGHTDSIGSDEYNKGLSQRRAEAVRDYMISKGVTRSRLRAVGYGEEQPVADNATEEGRALNRRVEMRLTR